MNTIEPILTVDDLRIAYKTRQGEALEVVRGVSFNLGRERLGIVGESGSGKSQTGRAIMGLTDKSAHITAKTLNFKGCDLLSASVAQRRALRGSEMAMILQDPKFSLNPVMSIGTQIIETLYAHQKNQAPNHPAINASQAKQLTLQALSDVQIENPERVFNLYPHEVSGGMGQRAMIAMMLITKPALLIADEPTSALDVTVQLQVLSILDKLVAQRGMGLIFVSHDLRLVSSFCDRVLVMYAGRVVEQLDAKDLHSAQHPYTQGLINCLPRLGQSRHPLPTLQRQDSWR